MSEDNRYKDLKLIRILILRKKIKDFCENFLLLFFDLEETFINKII
jgi:hypothetical protein